MHSESETMKVMLKIEKDGVVLHEHSYSIFDAESFGKAFSDAWTQLHEERSTHATSIGALIEHLNDQLLEVFDGARISLTRV